MHLSQYYLQKAKENFFDIWYELERGGQNGTEFAHQHRQTSAQAYI